MTELRAGAGVRWPMLGDPTRTTLDSDLLRLAREVHATGYAFVTPTPATIERVNGRPGNGWARDLRDVFGWSRPFREAVLPAPVWDAARQADVVEPHKDGWRSTVRFSTLAGLQFMHSAFPTTAADAVFFGPDTYRFAQAIQHYLPAARRVVDIGCGAGPGAILIASALGDAEVLAVDINPSALRATRVNADLAGVTVEAVQSDLLHGVGGAFDLIVANPPYLVDPGERTYRHGGGALGAGLSLNILETAIERLAPGGTLLLYTGAAIIDGKDPLLAEARSRLAGSSLSWTYRELDPDVFGEELADGACAVADRIAAVLLTATRQS